MDQARKHAREYDDSLYLAMVYAAQGRVDRSAGLLRDCVSADGIYDAADVLRDQLFGELPDRPELAVLRKQLHERAMEEEEEYGYPMGDAVETPSDGDDSE